MFSSGISRPDLRLTDGSGALSTGVQKIGTPRTRIFALRKMMTWRFVSRMTLSALIDQVGVGFFAQTGQGVKIAWLSSVTVGEGCTALAAAIDTSIGFEVAPPLWRNVSLSRVENAMATPADISRSSTADCENSAEPSGLTMVTSPLAVTTPVWVS